MREITLRGKKAAGRVALIDDEDYELVSERDWYVWERLEGQRRVHGPYAYCLLRDGRFAKVFMHQFLTGWPKTDHEDHDGLNNQRSNLREATTAQNNHNQRPRIAGSSRYKGVTWHRQVGKWQATIKLNGKCHYLGVFLSEEEAARAYNEAALNAYGSYAYLNQIEAGAA